MADFKTETKAVARHSSVYMLATILNKVVSFLMIPIYTRFLVPSDYGVIELLGLTTDVIGMVISVGIAGAMYRFYFDYDNDKDRNEVISTAILSFGAIALVSLGAISLSSNFLALKILNSEKYYYYFLIAFCSLWFNTIVQMGYSYLRIKEKSIQYLIYSLCRLILGLSLNIYLVAIIEMGVMGVLLSTLIGSITFSIFLVIPILIKVRARFSLPKCKKMLKYGAPLIPTNLAAFVVHASDRFFINHYVGLADTGIYSLGYKFGNLPNNFIAAPFMQIWEIRFFKWYKDKNAHIIFGRIFTYLCFLTFFVGLGISVLIKDALVIMSDSSYWSAYKIVPIIIISYIVFSFQYYFNMGIYITKKTKYLAYINMSNAGLNIILNFVLISRYGIWGAAFATLACFTYKVIITYYIGNKLYKISFEAGRILKLAFVAVILYFVCHYISIDVVYVSLLLKFGIACLFPIVLYLVGFYTLGEKAILRRFFKEPRFALTEIWAK